MPCSVNAASEASCASVRPRPLSLRAWTACAPAASARSQAAKKPGSITESASSITHRVPLERRARARGRPGGRRRGRAPRPARARAPTRRSRGRSRRSRRCSGRRRRARGRRGRRSALIAARPWPITRSSLWAGTSTRNRIAPAVAAAARDRRARRARATRGAAAAARPGRPTRTATATRVAVTARPRRPASQDHRFAASFARRGAPWSATAPRKGPGQPVPPGTRDGRCFGPGSSCRTEPCRDRSCRRAGTHSGAESGAHGGRTSRTGTRPRSRGAPRRLEQALRIDQLLAKRTLSSRRHARWRMPWQPIVIPAAASARTPSASRNPGVAEPARDHEEGRGQAAPARSAGSACPTSEALPSSKVIRTSLRPATESSTDSNARERARPLLAGIQTRAGSPMPWKVRVIAGRPEADP